MVKVNDPGFYSSVSTDVSGALFAFTTVYTNLGFYMLVRAWCPAVCRDLTVLTFVYSK